MVRIEFGTPTLAPMAHTRFCLKYPAEMQSAQGRLSRRGGQARRSAALNSPDQCRREPGDRAGARRNETVAGENWLISPKSGDCNDFAVTKRHELLARGWPARSLLLAEVVVPWGEHHLVLVIRTQDGDLVATISGQNIRAWTKTGYQWVRVQSAANPTFWS